MITTSRFFDALYASVPRFARYQLNPEQHAAVVAPPDEPLMIVAGPGSGKTTVLVLRAIRLMLTEGMLPETIVLTTFTTKAADELRARLLDWGREVLGYIRGSLQVHESALAHWLKTVDINRIKTGTLDSICQDVLRTLRSPGDIAPVLVEDFAAKQIMLQSGIFPSRADKDAALKQYVGQFCFDEKPPRNVGECVRAMYGIYERVVQDRVDASTYGARGASPKKLCEVFGDYTSYLRDHHLLDFPQLEQEFLDRLQSGRMAAFTTSLNALLVDEYQDTNPLQEAIYHELMARSGSSITVVGDDDQSLYRFRGATVELFRDFQARLPRASGVSSAGRLDLYRNYRSTPEIVDFFNSYITSDPSFQAARVQPLKRPVIAECASNGVPVLGMFRDTREELAEDLAGALFNTFRGQGWVPQNLNLRVQSNAAGGDFGDAVLLCHSVNEHNNPWGNKPRRARLPLLLRHALDRRGVGVFNPRGTELRGIPHVQVLLGLVAECLDAGGALQNGMSLTAEAHRWLDRWRNEAKSYAQSNPQPATRNHNLSRFVDRWGSRQRSGQAWPTEWPLLDLIFKLICWIPELRDDPEGQVYLEAITRTISTATVFSPYQCQILHGHPVHAQQSVKKILRHVLSPIAEETVAVDEDLLTHVPRSHLPIMTIHQAKGLEFPLTIVDVTSDYSGNYHKNRFKRHPTGPSAVQRLEDEFSSSPVGTLRTARSGLLRAFDDIIRLHYVGYSRSQSILLLVGLSTSVRYNSTIRHAGLCWHSNDTWAWKGAKSNGSLAGALPFTLV